MNDTVRLNIIRGLLDRPFDGYGLTKKELEATRLIAFGYTQTEVSKNLGITRNALNGRLESACRKIKLKSSKELTRWWVELLRDAAGPSETED